MTAVDSTASTTLQPLLFTAFTAPKPPQILQLYIAGSTKTKHWARNTYICALGQQLQIRESGLREASIFSGSCLLMLPINITK